ncbi:tyrosine protein phosphatase [Periweissella cryptocerci]|uniref:Tyrosine-protein phosphatase n=1 Tax=Periweissella cryptocerci TaxID=2506420 RepID=A0A4P6YWY1_9LACO|nr:CpsB/CapC family capsule biosynthesis tyrosine phosphatase [Periweissella cryptocerci]QBO37354.1 tyrosine protein phosphatase [Periweissella cryptocerci]
MIDIHSHLLPNIDDGSPSLAASLDLAQQAVADGVTHVLMTPHHMNEKYENPKASVIAATAAFQAELDANEIPLTVFPSQEIRLTRGLLDELAAGELLGADENAKYLLIEFPDNVVPDYAGQYFYELQRLGHTPIIAHPERNTAIINNPELLKDLLKQGALAQLTASSYVGTFGTMVAEFAEQLVAANWVNFVVSDAHVLPGRKYEMTAALQKLGSQRAAEYEANAKAAVNGTPIKRAPMAASLTKPSLFKRLFSK